jgi:hypothetical protein
MVNVMFVSAGEVESFSFFLVPDPIWTSVSSAILPAIHRCAVEVTKDNSRRLEFLCSVTNSESSSSCSLPARLSAAPRAGGVGGFNLNLLPSHRVFCAPSKTDRQTTSKRLSHIETDDALVVERLQKGRGRRRRFGNCKPKCPLCL